MQAKCLRGRCLRFREVGALKAHRHSTQTFQGHIALAGHAIQGLLNERQALFFAIRHGAAHMTAPLMHRRP
jgi:hypothetical protein